MFKSVRRQRVLYMYTNTKGSYRFLDPKFKTFSILFSKTTYIFSRLKVIKLVINIDLEKCKNKAFAWCTANIRAS